MTVPDAAGPGPEGSAPGPLPALLQAITERGSALGPRRDRAADDARRRQDALTKPRGSLALLEELSIGLARVAGTCPPPVPSRPVVAVFAADHGVQARGVSPWPQEVTAQMVANFLAGGAAVNAIARQVGAQVVVVDVGVATALPEVPARPGARLVDRRVAAGTADLTRGPAMTRAEALTALGVGAAVAADLVDAGHDLLLPGDMGIANTTAAAALVAAFTGADPALVTGRGTGIDDATLGLKTRVVREALARHPAAVGAAADDPVGALAALGGLEHAAITGFLLAACARGVPVLLDGVSTGAAALVAAALAPSAVPGWFAGHRSAEPAHTVALDRLGLTPVVDLGLRLGEGTGALLAVPTLQAAARVLAEMATFDSAGVADKGHDAAGGAR